jgi:hypothetical protein
MASAASQLVDDLVPTDRVQPRQQTPIQLDGALVAQPQEDMLHRVAGGLFVARQADGVARQAAFVFIEHQQDPLPFIAAISFVWHRRPMCSLRFYLFNASRRRALQKRRTDGRFRSVVSLIPRRSGRKPVNLTRCTTFNCRLGSSFAGVHWRRRGSGAIDKLKGADDRFIGGSEFLDDFGIHGKDECRLTSRVVRDVIVDPLDRKFGR